MPKIHREGQSEGAECTVVKILANIIIVHQLSAVYHTPRMQNSESPSNTLMRKV